MLASSVLAVGVKVPVHVLLSALVIVVSVPLATVMSAVLEKEVTASEKTSVTVALSPALSAVSERVKEFTEGARVSTTIALLLLREPVAAPNGMKRIPLTLSTLLMVAPFSNNELLLLMSRSVVASPD